MSTQTIGWIGLGSMGLPMAMNLQKHRSQNGAPNLLYHNRTMSRGASLLDIGGVQCPRIGDLVAKADMIFISMSNDAALKATLDAILLELDSTSALAGKIFVDTSTVHPSSSETAQQRLATKGVQFVAAPVFGASPVAAQGRLLWILAGPKDAVQAITPFIVGVMGRDVIRLGEDVKQSTLLKTAGNFLTAGMMEIIAEAHVFAEKSGIGADAMEALLKEQYGPLAFAMSQRLTTGAYMPARNERPWSDLQLALKDVGHGIDCAQEMDMRLEVAEVALKHLEDANRFSETEKRPLDSSSMFGVLRQQAGLPFATDLVRERDNKW